MKRIVLGAAVALSLSSGAFAQSTVLTQVPTIGPNDLFVDVPNGIATPSGYFASSALIGNYAQAVPGGNPENIIPGGDATTNLWAHGTTGSSVTTTLTYGGPNSFAYWSGASTAMTISQDSTASDLLAGNKYAFKMARTSGQTGVVPMCMIHEVESANSYQFAGQTVELDAYAYAGTTFSGTGVTGYLIYGTGADQGTASAAYGLNAGGGGGSGWTGQTNLVGQTIALAPGNGGRMTWAAAIPATATEVAAAICYTPSGTAGTSDYIALSDIQLARNSALTPTVGVTGVALALNDSRAKNFARRAIQQEVALQQRYAVTYPEAASGVAQIIGQTLSTTSCQLVWPFPVPMRAAPTLSQAGTAITSGTTFKVNQAGTLYNVSAMATQTANSTQAAGFTVTAATMSNASGGCTLQGLGGGAIPLWSAEL
jgi:hypothetical protein